jgi:predicted ATPase
LKWVQEALALAQDWPHPFSLAFALRSAGMLHQFRGEGQAAKNQAEWAITLSTEQRFVLWLAVGEILQGWARVEQGEIEEGLAQMLQSLTAYQAMGMEVDTPYFLTLLAKAYGQVGQIKAALKMLAEALAVVEKTVGHYWQAELYRLKGEFLLQAEATLKGAGAQAEAETYFGQAIEIARRQSAKSLELRAVMSLSRLWQSQGKQVEAKQMLAAIYGWFTEGFDTADLQEAKALLEAL